MSKQVTAFVRAHFTTIVDGILPEYATFGVREGEKSWPQVARLPCTGQRPEQIDDQVAAILDDIVSSAREERRKEVKLRVIIYRAEKNAAQRTFTLPGVTDGSHEDDETSMSVKGELLGVVRELRILACDQGGQIQRSASRGWELLVEEHARRRELEQENAQMKVELAIVKAGKQMSPEMAGIMQEVAKNSPQLLVILGQMWKDFSEKRDG